MQESIDGVTVASAVYEIGGRRLAVQTPGFADAIAEAHTSQQRPRCLCVPEGVEMYVARLGGGYIVKRMPETGSRHAPDCPSYEPPADASGLGQVLGSAIVEDPETGQTRLRLDFPLTKLPGRSGMPPSGGESGSVASRGTRLSLRGLLHYLWDQADLTRWHPGFAGKRNWSTVRRHLLQAAEHKAVGSTTLGAVIYVPEPFFADQSDAIDARRRRLWKTSLAAAGQTRPLMLLIGEVKEISPARYGFKLVIKHLPEQALKLGASLYRRLQHYFDAELAMWGADETIHLVVVATFGLDGTGLAEVHELSLMPVTRQWLPVSNGFERELVDLLVNEGRAFVKGLRYNLESDNQIASATLTDCDKTAAKLFVFVDTQGSGTSAGLPEYRSAEWTWNALRDPIPLLPTRSRVQAQRRASPEALWRP